MDKKHLNDHISKIALETPDQPENVPFSGKKVTIRLWCLRYSFNHWILISRLKVKLSSLHGAREAAAKENDVVRPNNIANVYLV
jgi:hypothetical protein